MRTRRESRVDCGPRMHRSDESNVQAMTLAARTCALEAELATLRSALEGVFDAFFVLRCERDQDGEVVDFVFVEANACGERMMQGQPQQHRPREPLIGARLCERFPVIRRIGLFEQYRRVVETREPFEQEYQVPERLDGQEHGARSGWYLQRVAPAGDGVAVSQRRISERKREQREREELREQLQHAQKMESLGRLAGGIAHDFNNLLTPILAYANMGLAQLDSSAPLYEELHEIRHAAERASGLIRQILTFSRKQPMQVQPVALNGVIEGLARMLRRLVGDDVEVVLRLADDLGNVMADPTRLEQVLINLVVNAREAITGEGMVTIGTANVELGADDAEVRTGIEPGRYVVVEVRDTGNGMTAEVLGQVFEPFFTTRDQVKGTGLGLSIVYGLVKQHQGEIRCESEPGRGTSFRLFFPRTEEALYTDEPEPEATPAHRGDATILLVEDDEAVRRLARQVLVTCGYRVLEADSGQMALRLADEHVGSIDLLVTDVVMPKMDGHELYAHLGAAHPELRVVFMTGYSDAEIGDRPFLAKPFAGSDLLRTIREALA